MKALKTEYDTQIANTQYNSYLLFRDKVLK